MSTPAFSPFFILQLQLLLLPPAIVIEGNRARSIFTCAYETPLVKAELFSLCFFPLASFFL
jgi:hypothetical protein